MLTFTRREDLDEISLDRCQVVILQEDAAGVDQAVRTTSEGKFAV